MTEDEAKTKICPTLMAGAIQAVCVAKASMVEAGVDETAQAEIINNMRGQRLCHGSGCVMWQEAVTTYSVYAAFGDTGNILTLKGLFPDDEKAPEVTKKAELVHYFVSHGWIITDEPSFFTMKPILAIKKIGLGHGDCGLKK